MRTRRSENTGERQGRYLLWLRVDRATPRDCGVIKTPNRLVVGSTRLVMLMDYVHTCGGIMWDWPLARCVQTKWQVMGRRCQWTGQSERAAIHSFASFTAAGISQLGVDENRKIRVTVWLLTSSPRAKSTRKRTRSDRDRSIRFKLMGL